MKVFRCENNTRQAVVSLASVLALALTMPGLALAQSKPAAGAKHADQQAKPSSPGDQSLADQIRQLQAKVAELEVALQQKHQADTSKASGGTGMKMGDMPMGSGAKTGSMPGTGMGMGMMGGKGGMMGMGMMSQKDSMPEKDVSEKGKMGGMKMMGRMKGMGNMKAAEPLPAFLGAPGIYHVGAAGFYLDQAGKIGLTPEQGATLNQIQGKAMSEQATLDEQISQAEEDLGMLTGSDQPDAGKIEAQARHIEQLRGDQRMAFIRSVGRAAAVLTDEQRKTLTAQHPAAEDAPNADAKTQP